MDKKDQSRFYDIDGVGRLPSVTTILSVISKPGLMNWQSKHGALKAINVMQKVLEKSSFIHDAIKAELGENFFKDGNSLAAEAADYGSQAHRIIEHVLKEDEASVKALMSEAPEPVHKAVQVFLKWRDREKFELVKAESVVHSKKFGYAGTVDAIGRTVEGVTLLDWKTSKRIYPEYSLQTVAYKYAAEEMTGERINSVMICRFGKDGSFESYTVPVLTHPDLFDRFMDAKRLWEWQREASRLDAA